MPTPFHPSSFTKPYICIQQSCSLYPQETDELQKKQAWYKQNQTGLTKEKETEYVSYCSDAMFRIHILEQRLNR